MKALIFAAGLGTRLKPFTDHAPKAMAPVDGVPVIGRVMRRLVAEGVDTFVVNVHHFADQIIDYLRANDNFGVTVHISDEREMLLETGGGLLKARQWLDGDAPFIMHNADILTDLDIHAMIDAHRDSGAVATLLAAKRDTSRYLYFDDNDRMRGWANIKTLETRPAGFAPDQSLNRYAFGGVHVVSPAIFDDLARYTDKPKFSIMDYYIDRCRDLDIRCHVPSAHYHWLDIGSPETLARADMMCRQGEIS
jgi:NDP-sugar pyrophosphorylase family protein